MKWLFCIVPLQVKMVTNQVLTWFPEIPKNQLLALFTMHAEKVESCIICSEVKVISHMPADCHKNITSKVFRQSKVTQLYQPTFYALHKTQLQFC